MRVIEVAAFFVGVIVGLVLGRWAAVPLATLIAAVIALIPHTDTNRVFLVLLLAALAATAAAVAVIGTRQRRRARTD